MTTDKPVRVHQFLAVVIDGRPPTPNVRRHWRQIARDNAEWKAIAETLAANERRKWESKHGLKWRTLTQAGVSIAFGLPDKRHRDLDNLIASTKPLLDGIVAAGLVIDDSIDVITRIEFGAVVNGRNETVIAVDEPG